MAWLTARWSEVFSLLNLLSATLAMGFLVAVLYLLNVRQFRTHWRSRFGLPGLLSLWWIFVCNFADSDYRVEHHAEPFWLRLSGLLVTVLPGLVLIWSIAELWHRHNGRKVPS